MELGKRVPGLAAVHWPRRARAPRSTVAMSQEDDETE
jgi:hypothetical protein